MFHLTSGKVLPCIGIGSPMFWLVTLVLLLFAPPLAKFPCPLPRGLGLPRPLHLCENSQWLERMVKIHFYSFWAQPRFPNPSAGDSMMRAPSKTSPNNCLCGFLSYVVTDTWTAGLVHGEKENFRYWRVLKFLQASKSCVRLFLPILPARGLPGMVKTTARPSPLCSAM